MLTHLSIRNVVLIERLDLTFQKGLTVITGETGSGKSILLDSLEIGLGERMSSSMLYTGATEGMVTATFDIKKDHPARLFLKETGIAVDDNEPLIFRRQILQEGRSKAFISDTPVALATLRQASSLLVEVQGQNSQIGLANPAYHLPLLDHFAELQSDAAKVASDYKAWVSAKNDLLEAQRQIEASQKEEAWIISTLNDLEELNPQEGEEIELSMVRNSLQQNERRIEALKESIADLNPKDKRQSSPHSMIRSSIRNLERSRTANNKDDQENTLPEEIESQNRVQAIIELLERSEDALAEADSALQSLSFDLQPDPKLLDQTEERLFALRAMARKHSITCDALPELLAKFKDKLDTLENGVQKVEELTLRVKEARSLYLKDAQSLTEKRQKAGKELSKSLHNEFPALKLERALFEVHFVEKPEEKWNAIGIHDVQFRVATNPGHPMEVLGKVASGGEMSRLMLALRVVLAAKGNGSLLVFDEIDSGVGGATATAIGNRLYRIGQVMQTIAITHSPQVAASGDQHIRIAKKMHNNIMTTYLEPLSETERREEIARMIAGKSVTKEAREAAEILINQSRQ